MLLEGKRADRELRRGLPCFVWLLAGLVVAAPPRAQEAPDATGPEPSSRRDRLLEELGARFRLDAEVQYYEIEEASSQSLSLSFTAVVGQQHSLNLTALVGDSNLDRGGTSGLGDTTLSYSWAWGQPIDAAPWVPDRVGPSLSLVLPTGKQEEGLGFDTWIAVPAISGYWSPIPAVLVLPGISYAHSFDEGRGIEPIRLASAFATILWVHRSAVWLTYTPSIDRDLQTSKSSVRHELAAGYRFSRHLGGSFGYEELISGSVSTGSGILGTREQSFLFFLHVNF